MGLGSLAEGQHSLPHPRRFSEDGRSTASLPRLKIQDAVRHAITKQPKAGNPLRLPIGLLPKGHKPPRQPTIHLPIVKKSLSKKALSRRCRAVSSAQTQRIFPKRHNLRARPGHQSRSSQARAPVHFDRNRPFARPTRRPFVSPDRGHSIRIGTGIAGICDDSPL